MYSPPLKKRKNALAKLWTIEEEKQVATYLVTHRYFGKDVVSVKIFFIIYIYTTKTTMR
jgi:hypothetical protein